MIIDPGPMILTRRKGISLMPMFGMFAGSSRARFAGIDNLDPEIWGVLPQYRFRAIDATASAWPCWGYGQNLTYHGTTYAPTLGQSTSPYSGPSDIAIKFIGLDDADTTRGRYQNDSGVAIGNVGTVDWVTEMLFKPVTGKDGAYFLNGNSSGAGYGMYWNTSNQLHIWGWSSTAGNVSYNTGAYGTPSGYDHIISMHHRGTNVADMWRTYKNGSLLKTTISRDGDFTCAAPFNINAFSDAKWACKEFYLAYLAQWSSSGMVPASTASMDAMATARYNALQGSW
jgi:hypothetical protein